MWNPLASLPPSNVGTLAAYSPMAGAQNPAATQAPNGLHPMYGRKADKRDMLPAANMTFGGYEDMGAWRGAMPERPDRPQFGARTRPPVMALPAAVA
jgi:hypothetical protein